MTSGIPATLREILACPKCHGSLQDETTERGSALVCSACALRFPIREGLPVLLIEQAARTTS